jgi:hypothetical protein
MSLNAFPSADPMLFGGARISAEIVAKWGGVPGSTSRPSRELCN